MVTRRKETWRAGERAAGEGSVILTTTLLRTLGGVARLTRGVEAALMLTA